MTRHYATRRGSERLSELRVEMERKLVETQMEMAENARQDADLRENPLFEALRITVTYELPSRKQQIMEQMKDLSIIEEMEEYLNFDGSTVIIGSEVVIEFDGSGRRYFLLGNTEGDAGADSLSCDAPLARALMGRKPGDSFEFNGKEVVIVSIARIG